MISIFEMIHSTFSGQYVPPGFIFTTALLMAVINWAYSLYKLCTFSTKGCFLEEIFSTGCFSGEIWLIAVGHPWKTFPEGRSRISDDTEICSSLFWHKNNYSNQQTIDITIALTGIIKSSFSESALWRAWIIVHLV